MLFPSLSFIFIFQKSIMAIIIVSRFLLIWVLKLETDETHPPFHILDSRLAMSNETN